MIELRGALGITTHSLKEKITKMTLLKTLEKEIEVNWTKKKNNECSRLFFTISTTPGFYFQMYSQG